MTLIAAFVVLGAAVALGSVLVVLELRTERPAAVRWRFDALNVKELVRLGQEVVTNEAVWE